MAVVIGRLVTETVLGDVAVSDQAPAAPARDDADIEVIVRRATERVLDTLRREWDR